MADAELFDSFEQRELEIMEIMLMSHVNRTSITLTAFIESRLAQGATIESIRTSLVTDLKNGGRIFGEFRNAIKSTAIGSSTRMRNAGQISETGIVERFRWIAVLVNSCDDCLSNHGELKTWDEWEASRFGLPQSGGTICRERCHCVLLEESTTELEPIQRNKK